MTRIFKNWYCTCNFGGICFINISVFIHSHYAEVEWKEFCHDIEYLRYTNAQFAAFLVCFFWTAGATHYKLLYMYHQIDGYTAHKNKQNQLNKQYFPQRYG